MKKLLKVLPVVFVICLFATSVFALDANQAAVTVTGGSAANGIKATAQNAWQTVASVLQILSVAAVVFAGVRYMFASADQKADIKKGMIILVIGAVLVFGATTILKVVQNAANSVLVTTP